MIHVPAGVLAGTEAVDAKRPQTAPEIEDGPKLHPETVRRLTCDQRRRGGFEFLDPDGVVIATRSRGNVLTMDR